MTAISSRCSIISRTPRPVGVLVAITPWAIWDSRVPSSVDHAPAHAGQAGIEAKNANRNGHRPFVRFMFASVG